MTHEVLWEVSIIDVIVQYIRVYAEYIKYFH